MQTLKSSIADEMAESQYSGFAAFALQKSRARIAELETSLARLIIEKENLLDAKDKEQKTTFQTFFPLSCANSRVVKKLSRSSF
jgi:hypothetical protein